jgi:hypothetical protein
MRPALRSAVALALVLVVYFAFPVNQLASTTSTVLSIGGLIIGGSVLAWLIMLQIRHQLRAGSDEGVRTQSLLMLLYMAVLLFALGYYVLANSTDDQFNGMETKTDSLYFTITTLGTVGFGDVHAVGQAARALVTAQIVFNLVFVGALASLLTGRLRRRAAAAASSGEDARP